MLTDVVPRYIKVSPEDIVFIKFIIESYEDLGIVRTLDPQKGEIVILCMPDTLNEMNNLIDDLSNKISIIELPIPDNVDGDWLLAESV
mgnify:CR=1 FL=1